MSHLEMGEDSSENSFDLEVGSGIIGDRSLHDVGEVQSRLVDQFDSGFAAEGSSIPTLLGKRECARELFPESSKKKFIEEGKRKLEQSALVPLPSPLKPITSLPKLSVSQIAYTKQRFAFEGKVLNKYGTYDNTRDFKKFLKTDFTDDIGFGTITLVFGPDHIKKNLDKIIVGTCIRVEGAVVAPKTTSDGGSVDVSLHVDATTSIVQVPTFETTLFFVPELSIRAFLNKVLANPALKLTIAFVIVQVDNVQKNEGGLFEQLTIADGPDPMDRATLTFVTKRKSLYYQLVDEFHRGQITPYLARNIAAWKEKSNTLSVLDLTLITPLYGDRKKEALLQAFRSQIYDLGYGKEIFSTLRITNFNGSLLIRKCSICKSTNLNLIFEGGFCCACSKNVDVEEVMKLIGEIQHEDFCAEVTLSGDACDTVLCFDQSLLQLYKQSVILTRVQLSEVAIEGYFVVDTQGQILGFRASNPKPPSAQP